MCSFQGEKSIGGVAPAAEVTDLDTPMDDDEGRSPATVGTDPVNVSTSNSLSGSCSASSPVVNESPSPTSEKKSTSVDSVMAGADASVPASTSISAEAEAIEDDLGDIAKLLDQALEITRRRYARLDYRKQMAVICLAFVLATWISYLPISYLLTSHSAMDSESASATCEAQLAADPPGRCGFGFWYPDRDGPAQHLCIRQHAHPELPPIHLSRPARTRVSKEADLYEETSADSACPDVAIPNWRARSVSVLHAGTATRPSAVWSTFHGEEARCVQRLLQMLSPGWVCPYRDKATTATTK